MFRMQAIHEHAWPLAPARPFLNADGDRRDGDNHQHASSACWRRAACACGRVHVAFWRAAFCARWAWAIRAGALRTGAAALHRAADDGRVDVVKALPAVEGIEVNAQDDGGYGRFIFYSQEPAHFDFFGDM